MFNVINKTNIKLRFVESYAVLYSTYYSLNSQVDIQRIRYVKAKIKLCFLIVLDNCTKTVD